MTLEKPRLGSDPPNGSGREKGATDLVLASLDSSHLSLDGVHVLAQGHPVLL